MSFTCKFKVKRAKTNTESLEYAKWKSNIHVEYVLSDSAELHVYFAVVVLVHQLEVLDRSLVDSAVKVQHKGLHLLVPLRRFVEEEHDVFRLVGCELPLNALGLLLGVWPEDLFAVAVHHWKQHLHAARTF